MNLISPFIHTIGCSSVANKATTTKLRAEIGHDHTITSLFYESTGQGQGHNIKMSKSGLTDKLCGRGSGLRFGMRAIPFLFVV